MKNVPNVTANQFQAFYNSNKNLKFVLKKKLDEFLKIKKNLRKPSETEAESKLKYNNL